MYHIRRDLFYFLDYVTRRSEKLRFVKKKKKWFRDNLTINFQKKAYFLLPWKNLMLLISQILNICNYKVLFG